MLVYFRDELAHGRLASYISISLFILWRLIVVAL